MEATSANYRFDAFLSYTTQTDYSLARDLEDFLGRFHEIPSPTSIALRQLRIWRDETGRATDKSGPSRDVAQMLEEYLPQCRYLVLLWSTQSVDSQWMRLEFDWFRAHRNPESILLGITDAPDPAAMTSDLFWPEMVQMGLPRRPWYDFRGFRSVQGVQMLKLRDYDEARVQLAADLNGYSPAAVQPIWWRNKVREQTERAEREAQARRRLELTECDARLEAARGWYERAFIYFEQRRYHYASRCLLNALVVAPKSSVPDHYATSLRNPGWSEEAWAFLQYILAFAPRRVHLFPQSSCKNGQAGRRRDIWGGRTLGWIGDGSLFAVVVAQRSESPDRERSSVSSSTESLAIRDKIELFDYPSGTLKSTILPPDGAGRITAWAVSRRSFIVAVGTEGGWLCLWSTSTNCISSLRVHDATITAIAFSSESDRIVTGSANGEIHVWPLLDDHVSQSKCVVVAPEGGASTTPEQGIEAEQDVHGRAVRYVAFICRNESLLIHRNNRLFEHRLTGSNDTAFLATTTIPAVTHDESGRRVAYSESDIIHSLYVDSTEGKEPDRNEALLYVGHHRSFIKQLAFSARDRYLLSRDSHGAMCVWNGEERELERGQSLMEMKLTQRFGRANRGTLLKHLEGLGPVYAFDLHPYEAGRVLVDRGENLEVWDLGFSINPLAGWTHASRGSRCAVWLPDGQDLVMASDDGSIKQFRVGQPEPVRSLTQNGAAIGYLSVSHQGAYLASASEDGSVAIRTLDNGTVVAETRADSAPFTVTFLGTSGVVAVGYHDGTVRVWDGLSGSRPRRIGTVGEAVLGLAATKDGATLIAGSSKEVVAWDVLTGIERWSTSDLPQSLFSSRHAIGRLAISSDSQLAAYGCMNGQLVCLNVTTGEIVSVTVLPPSVPLKPEHVTAVGISEDNRTAFAGLWDGTLCVVDLIRGRELFRFPAHTKVITSVAQSSKSGDVITTSIDLEFGGDNQYVRVWKIADLQFASYPQRDDVEWAASKLAAFQDQFGDARSSFFDNPSNDNLTLSFVGPKADKSSEGGTSAARSYPDFPSLRAALVADPDNAQRNLDLAMAFISRDDRNKAVDYLARALRLGEASLIQDPIAQYLIAEHALEEGDTDGAIPWLIRAGNAGEARALLQLGLLCMTGHKMMKGKEQGVEYFRQSAELGNPVAAYNLGAHYEHEEHGALRKSDWRRLAFGNSAKRPSENLVRAFDWYKRSAENDFALSQIRIGDFFVAGDVVGRDMVAARIWYSRAADQGSAEATEKLIKLDKASSVN